YFTAVNIDGENLQKLTRSNDKWYFDPRIPREDQMGPPVYKHPDLDRGHLVRRIDPVWGDAAAQANDDTFHFTNCSPQHSKLNQRTWLGLEDYILSRARAQQFRVTVFTGPVFRESDPPYLEVHRIPEEFWKVAVMVKDDGQLSATAYLQSQRDLISDLEVEAYGQYKTYQVPIADIEGLTGLDFGALRQHDPLRPGELEAAAPIRLIGGVEDLVL
ncbi:MAG: DNA/RNA non-specific endonuclease, partial [Anaerolineales bacterium]|nr:DNA/RNA non-specific endonuclease [Anaerolineales bacterium]